MKSDLLPHNQFTSILYLFGQRQSILPRKNKLPCQLLEDMSNNKRSLNFQQVITCFSSHFRTGSFFPVFHLNRTLKVFHWMVFYSVRLRTEKEGYPLGYFP